MKLKRMELQGFKSFAEKINLEFSGGITSIVGPNGSGKSNVSDALCWVMGEQSAKTLRGANMQDVIFAGTETRSPLGFAEVTIVLDNSTGKLEMPHDEVAITRRVFRSGESEYAINKVPCRLKDVHELLMDTGLGRDGYSVIGQGKIAEILSSKAEDRRQIFEEAAGISKYRYRREESLRKLAATDENLTRISDIISEIETQLEPLAISAEKAKRYLKLRDELRELEGASSLSKVKNLRSEQSKLSADLAVSDKQNDDTQEKISAIDAAIEQFYAEIKTCDEVSAKRAESQKLANQELSRVRGEAQVARNNIENASENNQRLQEEISELRQRAETGELAELENQLTAAKQAVGTVAAELSHANNQLQTASQSAESIQAKSADIERHLLKNEARTKMLSDMERDFDGYGRSVKAIMQWKTQQTNSGILGTIAQTIKVSPEFALAIEVALGNAAQNIITETEQDAKHAIQHLKQNSLGRATFLPLNSTTGTTLSIDKSAHGIIDIASNCVEFSPEYQGIMDNLLGRIIVMDTMDNAIRYSRATENRHKIVTLTGEVFFAGGAISGGSKGNITGLFSRASELETLKQQNQKLNAELTVLNAEIETHLAEKREAAEKLETARNTHNQRNQEMALIEQKHRLLTEQVTALRENLARKVEQSGNFDKQVETYQQNCKELEEMACQFEQQLLDLEREAAENIRKRRNFEEQVRLKQDERRSYGEAQVAMQKELSRLQSRHERLEVEIDAILLKMWEDYDLILSEMENIWGSQPVIICDGEECRPETLEGSTQIKERISAIKSEIKTMGNIDIDSIETHQALANRYDFMNGQREDLVCAKANLENIIEEMTAIMKTQFEESFAIIQTEFKQVFAQLFGGGTASLSLTDPTDSLTTGIEITVQPPGKAVQNMLLLSGGEKALTAIALLLSLLKVRPAPFCVFDEIDAALDDVNVTRYSSYLKEYSQKTQFILITHKRGTMEESNMLYGVTMQEKGISTLISLNVDEVMANTDNNETNFIFAPKELTLGPP